MSADRKVFTSPDGSSGPCEHCGKTIGAHFYTCSTCGRRIGSGEPVTEAQDQCQGVGYVRECRS